MLELNQISRQFQGQVIHDNLPKYPAGDGPNLARQLDARRKEIESAREAIRKAVASAEEALIAVAEQEEARSDRRDRLQGYLNNGPRAVAGGVVSLNGARR